MSCTEQAAPIQDHIPMPAYSAIGQSSYEAAHKDEAKLCSRRAKHAGQMQVWRACPACSSPQPWLWTGGACGLQSSCGQKSTLLWCSHGSPCTFVCDTWQGAASTHTRHAQKGSCHPAHAGKWSQPGRGTLFARQCIKFKLEKATSEALSDLDRDAVRMIACSQC